MLGYPEPNTAPSRLSVIDPFEMAHLNYNLIHQGN